MVHHKAARCLQDRSQVVTANVIAGNRYSSEKALTSMTITEIYGYNHQQLTLPFTRCGHFLVHPVVLFSFRIIDDLSNMYTLVYRKVVTATLCDHVFFFRELSHKIFPSL